jgi:hypothetical protein
MQTKDESAAGVERVSSCWEDNRRRRDATFGDWPQRLQQQGQQVLLVAVDGRAAGFIGVIDQEIGSDFDMLRTCPREPSPSRSASQW